MCFKIKLRLIDLDLKIDEFSYKLNCKNVNLSVKKYKIYKTNQVFQFQFYNELKTEIDKFKKKIL